MKLPERSDFGKYRMSDGSIIYPSGRDYDSPTNGSVKMRKAGKFMLWHCTGTETAPNGLSVPRGEFITDRHGPVYFDSAVEAMQHIEELIR